jgi:Asp-tRNA(Asn)/Glu-tRNA(Gln) amidotransferase A subunit family amidase
MEVTELCYTPAAELVRAIRTRQVSTVEVLEAVLGRIARVNPRLNAFATLVPDEAREAARRADTAVREDPQPAPLHGVPFMLKDLTPTKGVRTTFGSKAFVDNVPEQNPIFVDRLLAAGGIFFGKTTTSEFGNKALCDSPLFGETNNPWKTTHVSGGSSGGAAAAVASGLGPIADGGDVAGSIRVPASCCGVVGLKPSFGRVPYYPAFSPFETTIHIGPITRTVADCALMLQVMAGPDPRDVYSIEDRSFDFPGAVLRSDIRGQRVAYSRTLGFNRVQAEVLESTDAAAQVFERDLGALVEEVDPDIPDPREPEITFWRVFEGLFAEDFVLPRLASPDDMDVHLRELHERGRKISAFDFYRATTLFRGELWWQMHSFFERYDLLLTPTLAVVPFPHLGGPAGPGEIDGEPIERFAGWHLTCPFNLTGQPAVTVPCGFSRDGLPIGLQIVGRRHADADVLRAAAAYEDAAPWAERRPPLD